MKNVLYIGNKLDSKTSNLSAIHTLGLLLESEGYTMYYASSKTNKLLRLLDMAWSCLRFSKKVDIVLVDTYSTLNFFYALSVSQICRVLKLPYVPILHGGNLENRLKNNPHLSHLIFKYAKVNISPSKYLKVIFETHNYTNVKYIPNTIEIENYKFMARTLNSPKLLWVRSFSEIYNPTLAVKIVKKLQDDGFTCDLCMVGPDSDGSLKEVKHLAEELNIEVKFTGKLTKSKWIELSKEYNVFINTTNFDNMPVSIIEAMALGLVVVSTNVGGMPYLIENRHDGVLVNPNNENTFAEVISELINSPKSYDEMVFNARTKVEQFDWEVIKHLWFKVLQ